MKLLKSLLIAIGIVTLGFTIVIGEVLIFKVFGTVAFLLVMALLLVIAYTTLFYLAEKDNWTQKKTQADQAWAKYWRILRFLFLVINIIAHRPIIYSKIKMPELTRFELRMYKIIIFHFILWSHVLYHTELGTR